jgi:hypothetical protein
MELMVMVDKPFSTGVCARSENDISRAVMTVVIIARVFCITGNFCCIC